jgi:flagellar basal-body rod protein FlgB
VVAISFEKALGMNEAALKLRGERASIISSNLVNADTPNYQARDINFHEALKQKMGTGNAGHLRTTNTRHQGFGDGINTKSEHYFRTPTQPSIDGNTVEENIEHAEFMKNSLEFQVAFTFLNSKFKGLTKAIKGE